MNSDSILIWRMKKGDEKSVDEFVRKYYDRILQYFRLRISDFGQAEDLTQETFEKFFRSFGEYRHYGKAINYLYVIAGNTCKDFYKKTGRRAEMEVPAEIQELELSIISTEPAMEEKVIQSVSITKAIQSLPEEIREVAVLYFCQECRLKEISDILGIGLSLVKYRVRTARDKLSEILREEENT